MVHLELAAGVAVLFLGSYAFGKALDRLGATRARRQAVRALGEWGVEARPRQESCRCQDPACVGTVCVRFADEAVARWHCARCGSPCDGSSGDFYGALRKRMGASARWYRRPEELEQVHDAIRALEA
jgi:hypothetical protein